MTTEKENIKQLYKWVQKKAKQEHDETRFACAELEINGIKFYELHDRIKLYRKLTTLDNNQSQLRREVYTLANALHNKCLSFIHNKTAQSVIKFKKELLEIAKQNATAFSEYHTPEAAMHEAIEELMVYIEHDIRQFKKHNLTVGQILDLHHANTIISDELRSSLN